MNKRYTYNKSWREKNRGRYNANEAKRRATKLQATPKWLTKEHLEEVQLLYDNCPKGYHVDHIVPLQGKEVCGLHVPWNLQIMEGVLNQSKGNKYEDEQKSTKA